MEEKTNIVIALAVCVLLLPAERQVRAEETFYKEYESKVRFEINTAGAYRAKLETRSKLLRLAKRILTTDHVEEQ